MRKAYCSTFRLRGTSGKMRTNTRKMTNLQHVTKITSMSNKDELKIHKDNSKTNLPSMNHTFNVFKLKETFNPPAGTIKNNTIDVHAADGLESEEFVVEK